MDSRYPAIARRSGGIPGVGVYRVIPEWMPSTAASEIHSGVPKSGSPALRSMMSRPSARRRLAKELTAMVAEGWSREILSLKFMREY